MKTQKRKVYISALIIPVLLTLIGLFGFVWGLNHPIYTGEYKISMYPKEDYVEKTIMSIETTMKNPKVGIVTVTLEDNTTHTITESSTYMRFSDAQLLSTGDSIWVLAETNDLFLLSLFPLIFGAWITVGTISRASCGMSWND
jgi:hypothetical protein